MGKACDRRLGAVVEGVGEGDFESEKRFVP